MQHCMMLPRTHKHIQKPLLVCNMKSYAHSRGLVIPWVTLDINCNSSYQDLWTTRFIRHYRRCLISRHYLPPCLVLLYPLQLVAAQWRGLYNIISHCMMHLPWIMVCPCLQICSGVDPWFNGFHRLLYSILEVCHHVLNVRCIHSPRLSSNR